VTVGIFGSSHHLTRVTSNMALNIELCVIVLLTRRPRITNFARVFHTAPNALPAGGVSDSLQH
jgi:hypothetical protein